VALGPGVLDAGQFEDVTDGVAGGQSEPFGAGMTSTSTEPALPVVFRVSEWGRSGKRSSQEPEPRGTWIMFSFAIPIAFWMARADLVVSTLGVTDEPVAVADRDDAAETSRVVRSRSSAGPC